MTTEDRKMLPFLSWYSDLDQEQLRRLWDLMLVAGCTPYTETTMLTFLRYFKSNAPGVVIPGTTHALHGVLYRIAELNTDGYVPSYTMQGKLDLLQRQEEAHASIIEYYLKNEPDKPLPKRDFTPLDKLVD